MRLRKRVHIKELTDEQLVLDYQASTDPMYVGELYQRYTHMVFLVCMKYVKNEAEAEDLSMQIFEKLMIDLERYEIRSFKFWLHRVTKNHCLAFLDKKRKQREKSEAYGSEQDQIDEIIPRGLLEMEEKEEVLEHLEHAITKLKDEQRSCIELFYLQKKSYHEVAELTGFSLKQVKSYIQNGKRNLKNHLSNVILDEQQKKNSLL
ncbi:MAG: sigma-70 family RNA polymerase sigma factor [Bacteroidota bacterium]